VAHGPRTEKKRGRGDRDGGRCSEKNRSGDTELESFSACTMCLPSSSLRKYCDITAKGAEKRVTKEKEKGSQKGLTCPLSGISCI